MKVTAWKTVEVEVEVDVALGQVLDEFNSLAGEEGRRSKLTAIDGATMVLERIGSAPLETVQVDRRGVAERIMQRLGSLIEWCRTSSAESAFNAFCDTPTRMRRFRAMAQALARLIPRFGPEEEA